MPETSYRSPGYFERETDLSQTPQPNVIGTPASAVGTANKGPAFVPVTVSNFDEFREIFGDVDIKHPAVYAAYEFLKHRQAFTFCKVLNAGANLTDADILASQTTGRDQNTGFALTGTVNPGADSRHQGVVQFLVGNHSPTAAELVGMPMFSENDSFPSASCNIVRGVLLMASGARAMVLDGNADAVGAFTGVGPKDSATVASSKFKLVISSTLGSSWAQTDGNAGVKIYTASFNPTSDDYFGKLLNTDPDRFVQEQHLLYADFPVDNEVAAVNYVGVLSGSANTSNASGQSSLTFRDAFGAFDTKFKSPSTTWFISQPYGQTEHDLFRFEAIDDGAYANKLYKISITNLNASISDADQYGTFTVQVRSWDDTDTNPAIIEQFSNCSLNPHAENYVAKLIGDRKVYFNFDTTLEDEKRLVASGKYANKSKYVRIIVSDAVDRGRAPKNALPFGFRGVEILKTNTSLLDDTVSTLPRLAGVVTSSHGSLTGSILPPIPLRVKVTKGEVNTAGSWLGQPGSTEVASAQFYWGVKQERNTLPYNSNVNPERNMLLDSYTKFLGIKKLDVLVTGSGADTFNNNKFTLAKVALSNGSLSDLTASVSTHMREAAYVRNGRVDATTYKVSDVTLGDRLTFGTILAQAEPAVFNRFNAFAKFTNIMYGGWDGTNLLDRDARRMNDKSTSFDASGGAETTYVSPGLLSNMAGADTENSTVTSYMTAIKLMTDNLVTNANILSVPSIRESYITDYAMKRTKEYGLALYVLDIPSYDDDANRLYDDSSAKPSVEQTANILDGRVIDNNYVAAYFPNVFITDTKNKRKIKMPASVAAYGAIAFNDRIGYSWFAPAGFNRAALDFVSNVELRLSSHDRDRLYESRINPIATFPKHGFVIYGQKTLQIDKSALDRVNVRRLLIEVKRQISEIAQDMVFEQNDVNTRNKFVAAARQRLSIISVQQGVDDFKVIMNETNNSAQDVELNRVNGKIIIHPTRSFEVVQMNFVITNSGVSFA